MSSSLHVRLFSQLIQNNISAVPVLSNTRRYVGVVSMQDILIHVSSHHRNKRNSAVLGCGSKGTSS